MRKFEQTLLDDVLAVFKRACQEEQYGLADHLLAALESMPRQREDDQLLDEAYLFFAGSANRTAGRRSNRGIRASK